MSFRKRPPFVCNSRLCRRGMGDGDCNEALRIVVVLEEEEKDNGDDATLDGDGVVVVFVMYLTQPLFFPRPLETVVVVVPPSCFLVVVVLPVVLLFLNLSNSFHEDVQEEIFVFVALASEGDGASQVVVVV